MFQSICKPETVSSQVSCGLANFPALGARDQIVENDSSSRLSTNTFLYSTASEHRSAHMRTCWHSAPQTLQTMCDAYKELPVCLQTFRPDTQRRNCFTVLKSCLPTNNVACDNQESMMLMHVTCKSQPYRRGNLAFKAACSLSIAIFVSPCKRPVIHLTSLALALATLDSRFAYEKTKGETTKKRYVFCNICK